jgi:hypothetical protein
VILVVDELDEVLVVDVDVTEDESVEDVADDISLVPEDRVVSAVADPVERVSLVRVEVGVDDVGDTLEVFPPREREN